MLKAELVSHLVSKLVSHKM